MLRKEKKSKENEWLKGYLEKKDSIIADIFPLEGYNDYPFLYNYTTKLSKTPPGFFSFFPNPNGVSSNKDEAMAKSAMETIERWYLLKQKSAPILHASYEYLLKKKHNAFLPAFSDYFSEKQRRQVLYQPFLVTEKTPLSWVKGYSYFDKKIIFIPSDLVTVSDIRHASNCVRVPDSTGASASFSMEESMYRGICEVVERDSFALTYFTQNSPYQIDTESIPKGFLSDFIQDIESYGFSLFLFDITTDIPIPSFMCILLDNTNTLPHFSLGLKTDIDPITAIHGSIIEALQHLTLLRDLVHLSHTKILSKYISEFSLNPNIDRALFWISKDPRKYLPFLFSGKRKKFTLQQELSPKIQTKFRKVITILQEKNLPLYYAELASDVLNQHHIFLTKVIIPTLHPIPFALEYSYMGKRVATRMSQTYKKNNYPHPLL